MARTSSASPSQLKWFGVLFASFNLIFAIVFIRPLEVGQAVYLVWAAIVVALVGIYYCFPRLQSGFYRGWVYVTCPIGWLVTNALLTIAFCLLIVPIGLVMKVVGYDPLQRRFSEDESSYWVRRQVDPDAVDYFKQY